MTKTETLTDLVGDIDVAMLVTDGGDGFGARPLGLQAVRDGELLFVIDKHADWVPELTKGRVGATLVGGRTWVSVSGHATLDETPGAATELGGAEAKAWSEGDPDVELAVLSLTAETVDYWTAPNKAAQVFGVAKGLLTQSRPDIGERGHLGS